LKIEISIEENNFNWKLKFQLNSIFKLDMYAHFYFLSPKVNVFLS